MFIAMFPNLTDNYCNLNIRLKLKLQLQMVPLKCLFCLTWFKIIMDNWWADLVQIFQGVDNLHDDGPALFLRH